MCAHLLPDPRDFRTSSGSCRCRRKVVDVTSKRVEAGGTATIPHEGREVAEEEWTSNANHALADGCAVEHRRGECPSLKRWSGSSFRSSTASNRCLRPRELEVVRAAGERGSSRWPNPHNDSVVMGDGRERGW